MSNPEPNAGHFEPDVISIHRTSDIEKDLERAETIKAKDVEVRRAVGRQLAHGLQGSPVFDADERGRAVAGVDHLDGTYRQSLVDHRHAQVRFDAADKEHGQAKKILDQFEHATHEDPEIETEKNPEDSPSPARSVSGWMRAISRTNVALPFGVYAAIIAASVLLGFLMDKGSFNALQLAQKTLGFSTTDGLAFAFAVLVPVLGHLAGLMVWWRLDPDADARRKRRPGLLLVPAAVAATSLIVAIVTLRIAYLHHEGTSVSVWPLVGISLAVLTVDLCASALRHNPWPAKRTELEDCVADKIKARGKADQTLQEAEKTVMVSQGNLAAAIEKLLDPYFVHLADKGPWIKFLGDEDTTKALASGSLMPPQDVARLGWLQEYTKSCPPPVSPKEIDGSLLPYTSDERDENHMQDEREQEQLDSAPAPGDSVEEVSGGEVQDVLQFKRTEDDQDPSAATGGTGK